MPKNLLDILPGYVDFCAEGAETEKFITFCVRNGIEIISPFKKGYILSGKINISDYKKLRKPARKFGLKIRIIKKRGPYFFIRKNLKNAGLFFGILFIVFFSIIMNLFIWEINVGGNSRISSGEIISSAEKMGLKTGTLAKKHFVQDMEWFILRENEGLASVEINIQGSCANIEVIEAKENPIMKSDDDIPVNLVASKYGVIRKISVFDGQEAVKIGDAVMKGDLLVSAVYEDSHNKLTLKHARAKIIAETDYNLEISFPLTQTTEEKGKLFKKTYEINFLGYNLKIGNPPEKKGILYETEEKDFMFFHVKLPIKLITKRYFDVKSDTVTYTFEQAKAAAFDKLEKTEKEQMSEMEIISKKTEEKVSDEKYIIEAEYIVLMNIAEEQPIESDIPWENTDDMS